MVVLLRGNLIRTRCDSILLGSIQSSLESIVVCCSVDEELMVDGALSCGQVLGGRLWPRRRRSVTRVSEPVSAPRGTRQRPSWPVAVPNSTPPDLIARTRFIPNGSPR